MSLIHIYNHCKKLVNYILSLIKWVWRAWPIIIIILLCCIHYILIINFDFEAKTLNGIITHSTQIIGALLILYTIDSNIGIIKGGNILQLIKNYFREFPRIKKSKSFTVTSYVSTSANVTAIPPIQRSITTIEEKLDYLQEQISDLAKKMNLQIETLRDEIHGNKVKVDKELNQAKKELIGIKSIIEKVSIGDIKIQFFGGLLMIYGTIIDFINAYV